MSVVLISTDRFVEHQTPPGHPECPERAEVMDAVAIDWRRKGGEVLSPRAATDAQLSRVHDEAYLQRMAGTAGRSLALDPDTFTSPETYEVALLAAGAAIEAVERVLDGSHHRALAMVRPPGHHAERDRAMGFCLFNNVAVAAAHAQTRGASRVAIVDYDVHHGNGTQHIFDADPSVLYVSLHQFPYYPGTGAAGEIGRQRGTGFTVNLPLEVGAVDEDYRLGFAEIVSPVVRQFGPDLILVSAGFDAHERDPIAGMRVTTPGFAAMTLDLQNLADELCGGRLALVTEGGYDLNALADSLLTVLGVLSRDRADGSLWPPPGPVAPTRGAAAVSAAKTALARFWRL